MNLRSIATRTAVAGATTALAAGALVGFTGTSANAETGVSVYLCNHPLAGDLPVTVSATADIPLPSLNAGQQIPPGILPVPVTFHIDQPVVDGLKSYGIKKLGAASTDLAFRFGNVGIPLDGVSADQKDLPSEGGLDLDAPGSVGAFTVPKAGTYDIKMPAEFGLAAITDSMGSLDLACTIVDESTASVLTMPVLKTELKSATATAPKSVKKGKPVKVNVLLEGANKAPAGVVQVLDGKKKAGQAKLKKGAAVLKLKKLKPGKHKLTVVYPGDGYNEGWKSGKMTVTVKKK